jgi:arginine deiminase
MDSKVLNVTSEIGGLKEVLLHRPGEEVENLTPDYLAEFLFDDIPYLKVAQEEHDDFARQLKARGVKVSYIENLVAEMMATNADLRREFVDTFLIEAHIHSSRFRAHVSSWLFDNFDNKALADKLIAGIRTNEVPGYEKLTTLESLANADYPFLTNPLPNVLFTRDPFATIGHGVTINKMHTDIRSRETLFADYVFKHHPTYKNVNVPRWFNRDAKTELEGGDELVINKKTLFIGISQRTQAASIEALAEKMFYTEGVSFERILAFNIPKVRAFMHLDTVFTQIDHNKFTIHPGIEGSLEVFTLTKGKGGVGSLHIEKSNDTLEHLLSKTLDRKVELFRCGGGDVIAGGREQWNDGANTLAINPGEVFVYSRNHVTNKLLTEAGIKLNIIPSSELSRGRGGPRCMSMPLIREDIKE